MGSTKEIAILFGAGAEKDFGIKDGGYFAKAVLGLETSEDGNCEIGKIKQAVKEYHEKCFSKENYSKYEWYSYYTESRISEDALLKASLKRKFLETQENACKKKSEYDDAVKNELNRLQAGEKVIDEKIKRERWAIINQYTSYMGILDKNFHTLISPRELGPRNFWKVIDCYTRAYLAVVSQLLGFENRDCREYLKILENPIETYKAIEKAAEEKCVEDKESYYKMLRDVKSNSSIVTTNYTPLCRAISGIEDEKIAYIHGRIGLFEVPRTSQVYDVSEEENWNYDKRDLAFPYIFLQSGVKPIVERRQIREYYKMIQFFDNAKRILVVGYSINYDDNHVSGVLHYYLKKGKEVVYLDYTDDKESSKDRLRSNILNKLKIDSDVENFIYESINRKNCFDTFKKWVCD